MTCYECGKKIHAPLQKFVSQYVHGETGEIQIFAHVSCAESSTNKWPVRLIADSLKTERKDPRNG